MLDCPEQLSAVSHSSGEQSREHVRLGVDHVGEEVAGVELVEDGPGPDLLGGGAAEEEPGADEVQRGTGGAEAGVIWEFIRRWSEIHATRNCPVRLPAER